MAKITVTFTLDDEKHWRLKRWLDSLEKGRKSEAIRDALGVYLGQRNDITLRDIYNEIQELKRGGMIAIMRPGQGAQEEQVSQEVLDNLSKLGL